MEFNEKLLELRKQRGLTQEELAAQLFVSRAAVSKWESGRGYPSIDSLKLISKFFSISLDDLLSGEELIILAEEDQKGKAAHTHAIIFGLLDCCAAMLFFLPFFAQRSDGIIMEVSLLSLNAESYIRIPCMLLAFSLVVWGILTLALQNNPTMLPIQLREKISLGLSSLSAMTFIVALHPYAAVFTFALLAIKVVILLKWH